MRIAFFLAFLGASGGTAMAATENFEAQYRIRLSYLPMGIATGSLKVAFQPNARYVADVAASGLGFAVSAKSLGTVRAPISHATSAAIDTQDAKGRKNKIRIAMAGGTVRAAALSPPARKRPDTVPLTAEHKRHVVDPISAMLMPVLNGKPALDPSQCNRTLPIFEGSERFDLVLTYSRTEKIKTVRGYEGSVLVCKVRYKPIAGHRSERKQVKYMENNRNIEAWFAPIEGENLLAPWRVALGTMVGEILVEATQFGK